MEPRGFWSAAAVFHIQATPAFPVENIFQIEDMAYTPILQAALR